MPPTQEQHENEQQRMNSVEHKLGLLDYRLTKNEEILGEIKEAIQKIVILTEKQQVLREDMSILEKRFEERKTQTQPTIDMAERMIGKIQGAGVIIFILLSVIGWVAVGNIGRLDVHHEQLSEIQSDIAVLQNTVKAHQASDETFHQMQAQ